MVITPVYASAVVANVDVDDFYVAADVGVAWDECVKRMRTQRSLWCSVCACADSSNFFLQKLLLLLATPASVNAGVFMLHT